MDKDDRPPHALGRSKGDGTGVVLIAPVEIVSFWVAPCAACVEQSDAKAVLLPIANKRMMMGMAEPSPQSAAAPKPRRRWFQFSLGMLFVVVTTVCCWLAYGRNWIRQRHDFLASHPGSMTYSTLGHPMARAPWQLRLFGEEPIAFAQVEDQDEIPTAKSLFPEAQVWDMQLK